MLLLAVLQGLVDLINECLVIIYMRRLALENEGFGVLLWLGLKVYEDVTFSTCPHLKYKEKFFCSILLYSSTNYKTRVIVTVALSLLCHPEREVDHI